jgi:hypothetical protein
VPQVRVLLLGPNLGHKDKFGYDVNEPSLQFIGNINRVEAAHLVEPEIHFHVDLHGDWMTILHRREEAPFAYGFYGLFVQTHP